MCIYIQTQRRVDNSNRYHSNIRRRIYMHIHEYIYINKYIRYAAGRSTSCYERQLVMCISTLVIHVCCKVNVFCKHV